MTTMVAIPKLVIRDPPATPTDRLASALLGLGPLGVLLGTLAGPGDDAKKAVRNLLQSLIDEGRRYAETPEGRRWVSILGDSPLVNRGWLIWSRANIDYHLRNAEPFEDGPVTMLESALRELATAEIEEILTQISQVAAGIAATPQAEAAENR
jgi:hypothetical protein